MRYSTVIIICVLAMMTAAEAQPCDSNFFSIVYSGKPKLTFTKAVSTFRSGTISLGNLYFPRGWMTKMTDQGSLVWSNSYGADYANNFGDVFNTPEFIDLAQSSSSSYTIGGSFVRDFKDIINGVQTPPPVVVGMVANIDQSGNVLWSKQIISDFSVNRAGPEMWCTNVFKLKNGDILAYIANDKHISGNNHSYSKLVCFAPDGEVKWKRTLNTKQYDVSDMARYMQRAFTQTRNGNIVIADGVTQRDFSQPDTVIYKTYAMHLFSLNPLNGEIVWESSYEYSINEQSALTWFRNIAELPDGNLSFITSMGTSSDGKPPYQYTPVNLITDAQGHLIKTIAYDIPGSYSILTDAKTDDEASGTRILLLVNGTNNSAILLNINAAGNVVWVKGYGNASQKLPPQCLSNSKTGYNIFFGDNSFGSTKAQVIITDVAGNAECANTDVTVTQEERKWSYTVANLITTNDDDYDHFSVYPLAMLVTPIPVDRTVDCQKFEPCCVDYIDTINTKTISICEGDSYTLPDSQVVKQKGRYDISIITEYGCDSTYFINVQSYKKPSELRTINDTCLADKDSITINATRGFDTYKWMNDITTDSFYRVYNEGTYHLNVSNYCGSKIDTFNVYKQCDYPIYMPTAFTPNRDQLNDLYRVPEQNKNRLVYLKIFDRFGQLIFTSTNKKTGWDGTIKGFPQSAGVYIYKLEMTGLTNKRVSKSGLFTLIR